GVPRPWWRDVVHSGRQMARLQRPPALGLFDPGRLLALPRRGPSHQSALATQLAILRAQRLEPARDGEDVLVLDPLGSDEIRDRAQCNLLFSPSAESHSRSPVSGATRS